jgi:hypothetical protein
MPEIEQNLLGALTKEGVLLTVSVRYWRAHSLGHKKLLAKEAMAPLSLIESRAHALVEENTFPFLNGLAHYLPNAKLEGVCGKLDGLKGEFKRAKEKFAEDYEQLRRDAVAEWRALAGKTGREQNRLASIIEAAFPTKQKLEEKFAFTVNMFEIKVPERLGLEGVAAGDQIAIVRARQNACQAAAEKIREEAGRFAADCVAALRQQTAQLCDDMLESMRKSEGGVHQKTLNRLVNFIGQFKEMNFLNDDEMERRLEDVRHQFLTVPAEHFRDNAGAQARLRDGLAALGAEARRLAGEDARQLVEQFGAMGRRKFNLAA